MTENDIAHPQEGGGGVHPDKTARRAVDACGGAYSLEEIHSGWADGHAFGLAAALEAVAAADALTGALLEACREALDTELRRKGVGETYVVHTINLLSAAIRKATGAPQ